MARQIKLLPRVPPKIYSTLFSFAFLQIASKDGKTIVVPFLTTWINKAPEILKFKRFSRLISSTLKGD